MKIILASSSENRQELLARLGILFEVCAPEFEEIIDEKSSPVEQVEKFALEKARSVYRKLVPDSDRGSKNEKDVLVMGFDSMIEFEGGSIGKPATKKSAFEMIQKFVGKPQKVISGVAVVGNWKGRYFEKTDFESTSVVFRPDITNCQIHRYLEFGDWKGKCGAYSILGTGIFFLEKIDGDFQNIIGVPVLKLGKMIREITGKSPLWVFEQKK